MRAKERNYRLGWTRCDKSADYEIQIVGVNVFKELQRGVNAVPALEVSDKFQGSIYAGVNEIKKVLKINEDTKLPELFIFDIPENKVLVNSFYTLERDTYANEDKKGEKDRIQEGKHDAHACLRYIFQRVVRWYPVFTGVPEYVPDNAMVGY